MAWAAVARLAPPMPIASEHPLWCRSLFFLRCYRKPVLGDGSRHRIDNSEELRAWVLDLARQIQTARAAVERPISVERKPGQCRLCGQRPHCGQARL